MSRTLYVTDLDGTLLGEDSRISPASLQILNRLMQDGAVFSYATARSYHSAKVVTRGLQLAVPAVIYNGAGLVNPADGTLLETVHYTCRELGALRELVHRCPVKPFVYSLIDGMETVSYLRGERHAGADYYLSTRSGDPRFRCVEQEAQLFEGEVFYFTFIGDQDTMAGVHQQAAQYDWLASVFQQELGRPEYWCELMPAAATKANGVKKLMERLGCDRVVAFGDGVNDLPLFRVADECYAVANGVTALKASATGVIGSNTADSVALFIKEHFYNGTEEQAKKNSL